MIGGSYPENVAIASIFLDGVLETLTDAQREQFFKSLGAFYCFSCGRKFGPTETSCDCRRNT